MNKKCVAFSDDETYTRSIQLLRNGFELDGQYVKPNNRIATIVVLQSTLGLRLGDVLKLTMSSFFKSGDRWVISVKEEKTAKLREFTTPVEVYSFIQDYAITNGIGKQARLFDISARQVERHLNKVFTKMGLPLKSYGSHSYRKYFATNIYINSGYNIELVRELLLHSSTAITLRYLSISTKQIEDALAGTVKYLA